MQFDEASQKFADGTVDILHIDGYHSYEAVAHDFDVWLPKLSNRGVVLFHDTNARRDDFGVWKFFEELSRKTLCFEFPHGFGLGIAAVGAEAPEAIRELCNLDEDVAIATLRETFSRLGGVWVSRNEALLEGERQQERVQRLERELDQRAEAIGRLTEENQELLREVEHRKEGIARAKAQLSEREADLAEREVSLARLSTTLDQTERVVAYASERYAKTS